MDDWSNPVVADIKFPQVEISQLPVLFDLSEMVVGQVQDLQPSEVVCALEIVAGQLVVGEVERLQVVGGHQQVGLEVLQVIETQVQSLQILLLKSMVSKK